MVKFLNRYVEQTLDKALGFDFNFDISADDVWKDLMSCPQERTSAGTDARGIHIVLLENVEQIVTWLKNMNVGHHPR